MLKEKFKKYKKLDSVRKFTTVWFLFFSLVSVGLFIKMFIFTYGSGGYVDFVTYYMGASIIRAGLGGLLYDMGTQIYFLTSILGFEPTVQILVYRSLPPAALLFIPATFFAHQTAYRIYLIINMLLYSVLGRQFDKLLGEKYIGYIIVFSFFPITRAIINNQLGVFFILLYFLIYLSLIRKKYFLVGLLVGLVAIKLNIFIVTAFVLFLYIKERKKYLSGIFMSATLLLLVSFLIVGPTFPWAYINFVIATEAPKFGGTFHSYFSLQPLLMLFAGGLGVKKLILINYVCFLAAALLIKLRFPKLTGDVLISLTILMSILFGYHVLFYESVIMVLVFFLFVRKFVLKKALDSTFYFALLLLHIGLMFFGFYQGLPNILKPLFLIFWTVFLLSGYNLDLFRNALKSLNIGKFLVK